MSEDGAMQSERGAVYVTQRHMLRDFLDEKGDEAYTIDEAIDWCDARRDPEFWKPKQLERALRQWKRHYLQHELNGIQKTGEKARQRAVKRVMDKAAAEGKPISERAAAKTADAGTIGRVKPRLYRESMTEGGRKRHEYPLFQKVSYEDGCKRIDEALELQETNGVKAVEIYNKLMAELPADEKKKLRQRYKHDPRFQQALCFIKESQAV